MKNPFKKSSIMDTVVNVGIGGAANVAFDSIVASFQAFNILDATTKNAIKIGAGALVGSMINNKYVRAAADGIATVGVSNLVASYIGGSSDSGNATGPTGLPSGTIGRVRMGNRAFRRGVRGVNTVDVMGK